MVGNQRRDRKEDSQQSQAQHNSDRDFLISRDLQSHHQPYRKQVRQKVGEDIRRRICEVECIDVDTSLVRDRRIPCSFDRATLKNAHEHVSSRGACTYTHHNVGELSQLVVAEPRIERQDGALDEAQASIVED